MAKNAYAKKLQQRKFILSQAERSELIRRVLTTTFQASVVALHEAFGFGRERQDRYRDALEAVFLEYGVKMDETDAGYADGVLERRFLQVRGETMDSQKNGK